MHFHDFFVVRTSQLNLPFTLYPTINYRKGSYILHVSELSSQVESWHHVAAAWSLLLCTWRSVNTVIEAFLWLRLHYTHFQTFISLIALLLSSSPLCLIPSVAFAPILSLLSIYSPCPLFKMHSVTLFCPSFHPCLVCTSWESPQRSQIVSRLIKVALQLGHGSLLREQMLQICLGVLIWGDQVQANGGWWRGVIRSRDSSPCEEQLSSVKHDVTQTRLEHFSWLLKQSQPVSVCKVDRGMVTLFPISLSVTVSPVMDPSSGTSSDGSWAPRHFTTHTVVVLYLLWWRDSGRN